MITALKTIVYCNLKILKPKVAKILKICVRNFVNPHLGPLSK